MYLKVNLLAVPCWACYTSSVTSTHYWKHSSNSNKHLWNEPHCLRKLQSIKKKIKIEEEKVKITPVQAFLPDKLCHLTIILSSTSDSSLVQWLIAICGSQHPRWLPTTIICWYLYLPHWITAGFRRPTEYCRSDGVDFRGQILKKGIETMALFSSITCSVRTDGYATLGNLRDFSEVQFSSPIKWRYLFHSIISQSIVKTK